jgi:hypothetical protein
MTTGCRSWSLKSLSLHSKAIENNAMLDRRRILQSLFNSATTAALVSESTSAGASNLPASTGADTSKVGTVEALAPIISLRYSLKRLESQLANGQLEKTILLDVPTNEQDFKRLFDAYSDPVSYKQKFLDQNAFLVYYTKGFDGPGRANIEEDVNERQTLQFGARNEAWISWENFLVELKFINDADNDAAKYLATTTRAVDSYLLLAPLEDIKAAQESLGVSW